MRETPYPGVLDPQHIRIKIVSIRGAGNQCLIVGTFPVGYSGGVETARTTLKTAGEPASLRLSSDREQLRPDFGDLAYITVEVVDANGLIVKRAGHEITFEVSGAGDLAAVGTANPLSEEFYLGSQRKAWQGRLMAVVRSNDQRGEVVLKASADGLSGAEVLLNVKKIIKSPTEKRAKKSAFFSSVGRSN